MKTEQSAEPMPDALPPERIELGDLVLRRWEPADLPTRFEAITASFEHLQPWTHPRMFEEDHAFSEAALSGWPTAEKAYQYGIFDPAGKVLGGASLHGRVGPTALEIGYWSHAAHTGRGIITRTVEALTHTVLTLPGLTHTEIHCDPANTRSAAIPHRLGYRLDRIQPGKPRAPADSGQDMIWIKDR